MQACAVRRLRRCTVRAWRRRSGTAVRGAVRQVKAQRELADTAEASRFTELRTLLEGELGKIEAQGAVSNRESGARIEQSERGMQDKLAEATGTLSAHLVEIEDKLDRALVPAHALDMAPRAGRGPVRGTSSPRRTRRGHFIGASQGV